MYNNFPRLLDESLLPILSEAEESAFVWHEHQQDPFLEGSLTLKTVRGRRYWYIQRKKKGKYSYFYLGPEGHPQVEEKIRVIREARQVKKIERTRLKNFAFILRKFGLVPVTGLAEEVLNRLSVSEAIFGRGMILGTMAFLGYQMALGFSARGKAGRTADIDLMRPQILCLLGEDLSLKEALGDLWEEFWPEGQGEIGYFYRIVHPSGLKIEVLAPSKGHPPGRVVSPIRSGFKELGAIELAYLDYLAEDPINTCLLGSRILIPVTVPAPERFVWHKLLVATRRESLEKRGKDTAQALLVGQALKARGGAGRLEEALARFWGALSRKKRSKLFRLLEEISSPETSFLLKIFDHVAQKA